MPRTTRRWLALAVILPLAASCGKTPSGTTFVTVHAVKPSAKATTVPTARPSRSPAPHPSGPAPTPVPGNQALGGTLVRVDGQVFDAAGALLEGVVVTARSLDARAAYSASVVTQGGIYHLDGVPEGVNVELVASAAGWTERRQVRSFAAAVPIWNRCDFGALDGDEGAPGAAFFLAERPEIVRTEPANGAAGVAPDTAAVRVVLSGPLGGINRARLERALRLLPANDAANANLPDSTTDVQAWATRGYPHFLAVDGVAGVAPYEIRQGSVFMADTAHMARCAWDADGQGLTLTMPGPLQAPRGTSAAYQLVLVSAGPDEAIRDDYGHLLGSDEAGGTDRYPPAGALVPGAFLRTSLALEPIDGLLSSSWHWAATHGDAARFGLAEAPEAPFPRGLRVATVGPDTRLELTFSEPLAAYDGSMAGLVHPSVAAAPEVLANYAFALGETAADLAGVRLERGGDRRVDPRTTATFGAPGDLASPFSFDPAAFVASPLGAPAGSVAVAVDPADARRLVLTVVGRPRFFDAHATAIAARASNLAGPGGQRLGDATANQHLITAPL